MPASSIADSNTARLVERMRRRIERLERILAANNIHVPDSDDDTLPVSTTIGDFPTIDFSERPRAPAKRVDPHAALETMPRILENVMQMWGTEALDGYLARLVIDERGDRQGFTMDVMDELLTLGRLARIGRTVPAAAMRPA
ncbi:MAG: hypothetical protein MUF30_04925 [Burkholderiales bacterium]|jgi:hypothetical protein|nr:hypothetical protein [Burkholderiales bacterium]